MKQLLTIFTLGIVFALFAIFQAPSQAQAQFRTNAPAPSLYTVENVHVDIESSSAATARDQAIEKAQSEAFSRLAKRILIEEEAANLQMPSKQAIQNMIEGFQIQNEKISPTRYIAQMTFRFNANAVSRFFNKKGSEHVQKKSEPILVLPFYQMNDKTLLWEEDNPWKQVWEQYSQRDTVLPVILPLGDLDDMRDIPDVSALSGEGNNLSNMAKRYSTTDVLAVVLMKSVDYRTNTDVFQIFVMGVTNQGVISPLNIMTPIDAEKPLTVSMYKAVEEIVSLLEDGWKQKMATRPAQQDSVLFAYVPFENLQQWVGISSRLREIPRIADMEVEGLLRDRANIKITFNGTIESLSYDLRSESLILSAPANSMESNSEALRYRIDPQQQ